MTMIDYDLIRQKTPTTMYWCGDYNLDLLKHDTHNGTNSFLDVTHSYGLYPLRGHALLKIYFFSIFIYFLVIFFFCHINILLLSNCRSVCFIHMNKFSKCNKNEHL